MIPNLHAIIGVTSPKLRHKLPDNWTNFPQPAWLYWYASNCGLRAMLSLDTLDGGNCTEQWFHVSVSRMDRLPNWEDLKLVKDAFIGRDREAIQVLPRAVDYVNLHPYCLHLWSPEP